LAEAVDPMVKNDGRDWRLEILRDYSRFSRDTVERLEIRDWRY